MKIDLFNIANFRVDGGAMFGVIPKAMWWKVYPADENNLITLALRSLVVDTGDHKILVDTGWGDKQDEKFFRYARISGGEGLMGGLESRGLKKDDITDVFLTHLHADHCGGALVRNRNSGRIEATFPNATIHVSRLQWEWAVKNNIREADAYPSENILPMKDSGRLNLIEREGELFPGFSFIMCNGHTPGMMLPLINFKGRTLVYAGDLVPTMAHIPLIWNMSYDIESLRTIEEKENLLKKALEEDYILVFQHDEKIECCTVGMTPKGIRALDTFLFEEIKY
ncbi:MAG TPA: MBL fold metallo-hydrolase [Bacteroidales bacterium]|nr:MBL fold metallo-hydrolase [Bacteroidales bacterium]